MAEVVWWSHLSNAGHATMLAVRSTFHQSRCELRLESDQLGDLPMATAHHAARLTMALGMVLAMVLAMVGVAVGWRLDGLN